MLITGCEDLTIVAAAFFGFWDLAILRPKEDLSAAGPHEGGLGAGKGSTSELSSSPASGQWAGGGGSFPWVGGARRALGLARSPRLQEKALR